VFHGLFQIGSGPFIAMEAPQGAEFLDLRIGKLAVNYMAGHFFPDYQLLNLGYGVRFEALDMDKIRAVAAGMLGPVRLVHVQTE
jgi:hypothetical protein